MTHAHWFVEMAVGLARFGADYVRAELARRLTNARKNVPAPRSFYRRITRRDTARPPDGSNTPHVGRRRRSVRHLKDCSR